MIGHASPIHAVAVHWIEQVASAATVQASSPLDGDVATRIPCRTVHDDVTVG